MLDNYPPPCVEMPIILTQLVTDYGYTDEKGLYFPIYFESPEKIKVITQTRSIDFNSLIGYIGGYIGLLLGNILV